MKSKPEIIEKLHHDFFKEFGENISVSKYSDWLENKIAQFTTPVQPTQDESKKEIELWLLDWLKENGSPNNKLCQLLFDFSDQQFTLHPPQTEAWFEVPVSVLPKDKGIYPVIIKSERWETRYSDDYFDGEKFSLSIVTAWLEKRPVRPVADDSGWISVEQDLPKERKDYLVFNPNDFGANKIDVARFDTYNKVWFQFSDAIHPTYWKELPTPPKNTL